MDIPYITENAALLCFSIIKYILYLDINTKLYGRILGFSARLCSDYFLQSCIVYIMVYYVYIYYIIVLYMYIL